MARAQAILAFYRNDFEAARRHAEEHVELARASGDPYEIADALLTLGGALSNTEPTFDAAIAALEESVRVARAAGIDTRLIFALPNLATWLPIEESERALALLDEAIEIATRIGDRLGVAYATGAKARLAARHGDWRTGLQGAVDSVEQALELGDHGVASRSLYTAGVALCALGSYEPAAVLFGKADTMTQRQGYRNGPSKCSRRPTPPFSRPSANNRSRPSPHEVPPSTSPTPSPTSAPKPPGPSPRHNTRPERSPEAAQSLRSDLRLRHAIGRPRPRHICRSALCAVVDSRLGNRASVTLACGFA